MAKSTLHQKESKVIYTLFGKPVKENTLMYKLCVRYYGDFRKFENDLEKEKNTAIQILMLDIREAFWCNEFRTEDIELRRKILYENYYSATNESVPI